MNVLFVLPYVPSLIRVRPYHFIRELARDHEVTVLALGSVRELPNVEALRALGARVETVPLNRGEALVHCGAAVLRAESLQGAVCQSRAMEDRLARLLQGTRFDVVHVEHFRAAYLGARIPPDVPALFDSVDCISLLQERTLQSSHSWRQRALARVELEPTRRCEGKVLQRFDEVVVTSGEDRDALLKLAPTRSISVIPNGVDLDYFRTSELPRPAETLIFSGKMSYHANVTAVLHFARSILPRVRARRPDVRFVVAGSDPPPSVRALAADSSIAVTGHLADLRPVLARATVSVCPVTVKVGIQNKILEAMAVGLPVVCSREGATGLEAQPERDVLIGADPDDFARQVVRLLDDAALRGRVARAGRSYVEANHRWSSATHQLAARYEKLVGHDPRHQVNPSATSTTREVDPRSR